ncbi:copper resistance CopC/CopD family protein [Paenibacillus ehimensis]|uniref:Copper resistance protein CopC n=1 Tax=Paenibacillus ehimensis TaxID=79264 RepID=A0ABT8VCF9_9BACL|nr:copper resistance protein CopC [Paenibacillus ehimensis]MDO3678663.1 copper resistance protein CopC [Paenibacillus ehimensis]MEC0212604.1 copper resistance protein CopC [Paenibacillus ehimensis]
MEWRGNWGESYRRIALWLLIVGFGLLFLLGSAAPAGAHASLVQTVPASGAELEQPPEQVVLTFNERLEEGLYYLRVYDGSKRKVTDKAAVMNDTRTTLTLDLPGLAKGIYVVTYHVISADGHPVDGTYLFAVGQSLDQPSGVSGSAPAIEHLHRHDGPISTFGVKDVLQFGSRILFYLALLGFTGWLLWLRWFAPGEQTDPARVRLRQWAERLQQLYLIAYILFMWAHMGDLIGDGGAQGLLRLFTQTTVGYAWLGGLLLALLSFIVLHRSVFLDYIWLALVWFAKSLLGHAAAFEPKSETLVLDWLHLAASSVWVGGLLMLLVLWRTDKETGKRFLPRFSTAALISILLLTVSGVLTVFIFLPDVRYIVETGWGKLLLAKTGLVLLVVVTAALIRFLFRKSSERRAGRLLGVDAVLMTLIVGVVGVFTYLTPLPANEPMNWHVMGEKIHMTAQISPNVPGVNDFTVKVWLPEKLGKPKHVIMKLQATDNPEIAPLLVPVEYTEDVSFEESFGLKRHTYKARGAYLPYPGHWKVEVRVLDSNDDETVYEQMFRVY